MEHGDSLGESEGRSMAQSTWLRVASVNGPLSVGRYYKDQLTITEGAFRLL
ncbi:hypothetical protein [Paenibacillus amylolyticus]|uniref:hypothetical protein n=1 Tax=Paenibacillus TaxID=44249 RepID=UPI003F958214